MSERHLILPPELLPGSPLALAWLDEALRELTPDRHILLDSAWMLAAAPAHAELLRSLAGDRLLEVGAGWVRLDPYALPGFRGPNRTAAEAVIALFPGAQAVSHEKRAAGCDTNHEARAGLCLQQRTIADRIVARVMHEPAILPAVLPALSAAGSGGCGDPITESHARALLLSACRVLGVVPEAELTLPAGDPPPPRTRRLKLEGTDANVTWSRARGMSYQLGGLRETGAFLSLEVQGDDGGRAEFVPGHPPRPRVFAAGDLKPVRHGGDGEVAFLQLERELRLPEDPGEPGGRRRWLRWSLDLRLHREGRGLDVVTRLENVAPGQRYRIWFPVSFHPRPSKLAVIRANGHVEPEDRDGPFGLTPAMPPITLCTKGLEVQIGGPGLREVELLGRHNDWVCAVTLLRAPRGEPAPRRVVRKLSVALRRV